MEQGGWERALPLGRGLGLLGLVMVAFGMRGSGLVVARN